MKKFTKKEKKNWIKDIIKKPNIDKLTTKARDIFSEVIDIPNMITTKVTRITTIDNNNILVEGYKNVADYYSHYIKVKGNNIDIILDGKDLDIKEITDEDLLIIGTVYSINFKK